MWPPNIWMRERLRVESWLAQDFAKTTAGFKAGFRKRAAINARTRRVRFGCGGSPSTKIGTLLQSSPRRGNNGHHLPIERREGEDCWGLNALDTAITALSGLDRRGGSRGPRRMGASARAKISAAQKSTLGKSKRPQVCPDQSRQRRISAAGLANIRAATKARWARWRAEKKFEHGHC